MTLIKPNTGRTIAQSWGLFSALGLLMLGNGLLGTLLGVRAEFEGFATATTGIIMASYYVGFLAGSQLSAIYLGRVGHIRVFAALASLASTVALLHSIAVVPWFWSLLRLVTGFCLAGLYVVAESWLNDLGTNETRGRLLSMYMVTLMVGLAAAQLLLGLADPLGVRLFVLSSVLVSFAVLPVTLSIGTAPSFDLAPRMSLRAIWKEAPAGLMGGLVAGMAAGALFGMGAVYAVRVGLTPARLGIFMAAMLLGSVAFQWPIGHISDLVPRRRWMVVVTTLAAVAAFFTAEMPVDGWQIYAAVFILGGLSFPLYSLSLSHVNDLLPYGQAAAASAAFVFVSGVGAIAGPVVGSFAIDTFGPRGLFWVVGLIHLMLAVFVMARIFIRERRVATVDQIPFVGVAVRSVLVARRPRRQPVDDSNNE
ncbi:MAG: MFS transporter [Acidimicrobiia bacterium]|nr:MFS transporter [Acidimicrobiia bacterium]